MVSQSQVSSKSGTINIVGASSSGKYEYHTTVDFDISQWYVAAMRITTTAHQSYGQLGLAVPVKLTSTLNYAGKTAENQIQWVGFEAGDTKTATFSVTMNYNITGQQANVRIIYDLPVWAITQATAFFTAVLQFTLISIVPVPTQTPPPTTTPPVVTDDGDENTDLGNGGLFDFFGLKIDPKWVLVGAGILTIVLLVRPSAPAQTILAFRGAR